MSQFLGKLGQLVEIECEGTETAKQEERYVEHFSLTGRRRVQAIPRQPRQWSLGHDALRGEDEALLVSFVTGAWGRGPWHWVPVAAQHGNILTPRQADLIDFRTSNAYFTSAGPVRTPDGTWAARSLAVSIASGWVSLFDIGEQALPVVPGRDFTWSADVDSGGSVGPQLQVQFRNAQGGNVALHAESGASTPGLQRVTLSRTVPDGAVDALVGVRNTVKRITRPQVTWTPSRVPYSPGKGCRSAVVDGASSDLRMTLAGARGILSKTGFTVLEVS